MDQLNENCLEESQNINNSKKIEKKLKVHGKLCWSVWVYVNSQTNRSHTTSKDSHIRLGYHSVHHPTRDFGMLQHIYNQFNETNIDIFFFIVGFASSRLSPNSLLVSDFRMHVKRSSDFSRCLPRLIYPYTYIHRSNCVPRVRFRLFFASRSLLREPGVTAYRKYINMNML